MLPSLSVGYHQTRGIIHLFQRDATPYLIPQLIPFKGLHDPFRVIIINRTVPTVLAPVDSGLVFIFQAGTQ